MLDKILRLLKRGGRKQHDRLPHHVTVSVTNEVTAFRRRYYDDTGPRSLIQRHGYNAFLANTMRTCSAPLDSDFSNVTTSA